MVAATSDPPIDAANHWAAVANGPYTEDWVFHIVPTTCQ